MFRFLPLFLALAILACGSPELTPGTERGTLDSQLVVTTLSEVPDTRPAVAFLGTSLTAGLGLVQREDSYVARVAALAESAGTPIRAINAGVSGETSAGGLRRVEWILREHIDVLVLELGANDGLRGQNPLVLSENLTQIIQRTRKRYPKVRVILAGMEAPPNLGIAYTDSFRSVYASVADTQETLFIPFLLQGVAGIQELNQEDRIHPNAEGHRKIAQNVWEILGPVLLGSPGTDH